MIINRHRRIFWYRIRMIAMIGLLFAVFAAPSVATDTCGPSDIDGILFCYYGYLNFFQLSPNNGTLPEYQYFNKTRYDKVHSSSAAIAPTCYVQGALQTCLRPFSCLSRDTYKTLGESGDDSAKYWADLAEWDFVCGPGYNTLTSEYHCLSAVEKNYADKINKCDADMQKTIDNGGDVCTAFNTNLNCLTTIFTTYCDKNAGAYKCGTNRAGMNAYYPLCEQKGKLNTCPPFSKMNPFGVMAKDAAFLNWH